MSRKKQSRGIVLINYLETLAMGLAPVMCFLPAAFVLLNADRIGPWFVPILFAYIVLFYLAEGFLVQRKQLRQMHYAAGSEAFYELYPRELKKALRRARKTPDMQRAALIEDYRSRLSETQADARNGKRSRISKTLYLAAGLTVLALALFGAWRLFSEAQDGRATGLAFILHFAATAAMLCTAIAAFRGSKRLFVQWIAGGLQLLSIWADLTNKLTKPTRYTFAPVWEGLIVLAVFAAAGFGLFLLARAFSDNVRTRRERQEFDLALFELNVIDEPELAYRFNR